MEIEFKFCIPPERLAAVQAAARRGTHAHIRMEARYFDTPDAALSSRGIAFRLRREAAHRAAPPQKDARVCERELDLKAGPLAGLAAIAARWATRPRLFLSTVSQAERGERLLAPQGAPPATTAPP